MSTETSTFLIKRHDTLPPILARLKDVADTCIELGIPGTTVNFIMKNIDTGEVLVNNACSIIDSVTSTVQYSWSTSDTDVAGEYLGEFEVIYPNNAGKLTVPTQDTFVIVILEDYDDE